MTKNVFTIPHGVSFVDVLAQGLYDMAGGDALQLARYRVLLPNRRSVRSLREAFLRLTDGKPLLLPAMHPIGDVDEDALALAPNAAALEIPPAIAPMRRRLLLARLIASAYADRYNFGQALGMADELAGLIDEVHTQGLNFENMQHIVSADFAQHWQVTVDFLNLVVREHWPKILAEEGAIDPALRRRLLLQSFTDELQVTPPAHPVIAVAQAGEAPAVLRLMDVVAHSTHGQVILPGLDRDIDDAARAHIGEGHPQALFTALLETLQLSPHQVQTWPAMRDMPINTARLSLIREVMRPGEAIDAWSQAARPAINEAATQRLALIEAASVDEEATAIALALREHADDTTRDGIAALVTPDRQLAGRVAQILKRWDITVDDSAGQPLNTTYTGEWLMRIAASFASLHAAVPLLAMLKHPLCAGGDNWPRDAMPYRAFVRHLDKHVLRGPRLAGGLKSHAAKIEGGAAKTAFACLEQMLLPVDEEKHDAGDLIHTHIRVAESLACTAEQSGDACLWRNEDGEAAARFFAELLDHAAILPPMDWTEYAAFVDTLAKGIAVRPRYGTHPRLAILGQIEARLFQSTRMILGGLNEDTWPPKITADPWMSRPMRKSFGLPAPERSITLAAHDFSAMFCAPDVIMTRATYRGGAPTIPSRWLQRLGAVLQVFNLNTRTLHEQGARWLIWAQALDAPEGMALPCPPPAPMPGTALRPTSLSVTELRYLLRDPYTIYARHVLGLCKLDALEQELQASDRGILIHAALEEFVRQYPRQLPDQPLEKLLEIGRDIFAKAGDDVTIMGLWWPRFTHIAADYIAQETAWRGDSIAAYPECKGRIEIAGTTLIGKADRIDQRRDGTYAIIDYKSGVIPAKWEVAAGAEPQLPVLALMLEEGGFGGALPPTPQAGEMSYWGVGSGKFDAKTIVKPEDAGKIAAATREGLGALLHHFASASTPYLSCPDPDLAPARGDYLHLARVAEWAVEGGDE